MKMDDMVESPKLFSHSRRCA